MKIIRKNINYIIIVISIILLKSEYTFNYFIYVFMLFISFCVVTELIELFLLLNRFKFSHVKNQYVTKKITSLNNVLSEIKENKLNYIFKSEIGFMFLGIILFIIGTLQYKSELNIAIIIITLSIIITSLYKVIIIFAYNSGMTFKFIKYNIEQNLFKKEEALYIINSSRAIIIIIILSLIFLENL